MSARSRLVAGIGLAEIIELEQRVAEVAALIGENTQLGGPLAVQVSELEAALLPVLISRADRGD